MASDDDRFCRICRIFDCIFLDFEIFVPDHYAGHDLSVPGKAISGLAELNLRKRMGVPSGIPIYILKKIVYTDKDLVMQIFGICIEKV